MQARGNEGVLAMSGYSTLALDNGRAANDSSVFTTTEKAPTWAVFWLEAPTRTSTYNTLLRHYAQWTLTHGK